MLALVSPGAEAQTTVEAPRIIRVVTDNVYAPYSFQSDEGKLQGIVIDQWQAWEKKTGIKVEIHAMDWGEALRRMRAGEFDVIDAIVETPEHREYFDFTPAYTPIEASVFFRNDISAITNIAALKGFPVGVKAGDQHVDKLKANGVMTVISFPNYDAMIDAAKQHKINVFVIDNPSALYLLNKAGIEGEFRHSAPMFHDELRRAVRKGDTALLRTVSEGFAAIEPDELKQINEKWFGRTINRIGRYLTYGGYAVAAALLIIAGLTVWNRTLRKKVLQRTAALGESEQRFRRLVELMPVAVYVCDTSGIIQSYNKRAVELWGREPEPGNTAQRYCASLRLWSPDGKLVPHEESRMAEALRTGVPAHDVEVVIERPDGSRITALVNIAPLRNAEGELIGAMNCFQDITERKRAEDVVRESQQLLHLVLATLPVGVAVTDRAGDIVLANEASKRIWGDMIASGRERWAQSKGFWHDSGKRIAPPDWPSVRALSEGQTSLNQSIDIETFDGQQKTIQNSSAPIRNAEGLIVGTVIVNEDVTERVRAEEALRQSEERFAAFMDNLPGYAWMKDLQGRYVYVNEMVRGLPGYRSLGKTDAQIWPTDLAAEYRANDQQVIAAKKPLHTLEHYQREGKQQYMAGSKFPIFDKTGAVALVGGAGVDITERIEAEQALRESEERFRELAENIDDLVWLSDPHHKELLYISPAYERIWGRTCASMYAAPRSWTEALYPEDRERILELRRDNHLEEMPDMTYRIVRPDGSIRWIHSREFPVNDRDGKVVRVAGIVEDITERKRVELALDERLRFETLLTELSAGFANLPTTKVDQEIDKWLQNLVKFLDLDRAIFDQVGEDGVTLSRSHSHTVRGIDTGPLDVANDQTPWITEQLLRGNTVKWSRIPDDIPEQAWKETEFAGRIGAKSVLSIPVCIGGAVICAVSFTSMRNYRDWSDEMVARLRLVGEIFANAVARKRAEEALFQRQAELNEAQSLASIGSWEWDILTDGLTYSDELRRIYGFEGEDRSSPNKVFSEAIHRDDQARRNAAIRAALGGGPPYNVEFRIIRPDKSVRFVHSRGQLICDEAGKPVRMIGMAQDITERKRAAKELEKANHRLRLLSRRLFEVQEEERRHLARELHDEIGQALTAAKINLQSVTTNGDGTASARLQETIAILDRLLGQVRQISIDLRPSMLDDLGLVPALRSLLDQQGRCASVAVRFSAKNMPENLDPEIQITCFRMAQEAITNAVRHAHATRVDVDLRCKSGELRVLVRDNGIGFDVEATRAQAAGLGLIGIKERATLLSGCAKITSSQNQGTTIEVSLPVTLPSKRSSSHLAK